MGRLGWATVMVAAAALSACDYEFRNSAPRTPTVQPAKSLFETRALLTKGCPADTGADEKSAAIIGAAVGLLGPLAADLIVNQIEAYMKARQEALTAHHVATTSSTLYEANQAPKFGCLVVARGDFVPVGVKPKVTTASRGSLTAGALERLNLGDYPDFYFEATTRIDPGAAGDKMAAMTITPRLLYFSRTAAGRTKNDSKTINLLVLLAVNPIDVGAKPDKEKALAVIPIKFENVKIGTEIGPGLMEGRVIAVPIPKASDPAKPRVTAVTPVNVAVYVEETEDSSKFDQFILSTFTSNKADISKGLVSILKQVLGVESK